MPWKAFKVEGEFCVFKLDGDGDRTGKSLGCHSSRKKANRQVAALNVQENKNMTDVDSVVENVTEDKDMHVDYHGEVYDTDEYVSFGTLSFEEYDDGVEAQKAGTKVKKDTKVLKDIIDNILRSDEVTDVKTSIVNVAKEFASRVGENLNLKQRKFKTEGGVKYFKGDFAYTPSGPPSGWKLRLAQGKPGNITKAQLGRAAAAFSPGGFRGEKVQIPSNKVGAVKARIRREYRRLGVKTEDIPDSIKELSQFMVFKDIEKDRYGFFTTYSNNIRDDDNPPEIIAAESHVRFEEMVDKGTVSPPQLWLWHLPSIRLGETEVVAYDKETGIAMAAGYFYKEAESIAEIIKENPDLWGVSHGMLGSSVVRSEEDETVIVQHVTKEISPVPNPFPANRWADFSVLKELSMTIPDEKRKKLEEVGVTKGMLEDVDASSKSLAEQVEELKLERKESDPPAEEVPAEETPTEEPVEEEVAPEAEPVTEEPAVEETEKPAEEDAPAEDAPAVFTDDQVTELKNTFEKFGEILLKEVAGMLQPITDAVTEEKKTSEEALKKTLEDTPLMSLQDLVLGGPLLWEQSATKSDQTIVDGRTKAAKDGPEITKEAEGNFTESGSPFIDMVIGDVIRGREPAEPAA